MGECTVKGELILIFVIDLEGSKKVQRLGTSLAVITICNVSIAIVKLQLVVRTVIVKLRP